MLHIRPSIFRSFQACSVVNVFIIDRSRWLPPGLFAGWVIEKSDQKQLMN